MKTKIFRNPYINSLLSISLRRLDTEIGTQQYYLTVRLPSKRGSRYDESNSGPILTLIASQTVAVVNAIGVSRAICRFQAVYMVFYRWKHLQRDSTGNIRMKTKIFRNPYINALLSISLRGLVMEIGTQQYYLTVRLPSKRFNLMKLIYDCNGKLCKLGSSCGKSWQLTCRSAFKEDGFRANGEARTFMWFGRACSAKKG